MSSILFISDTTLIRYIINFTFFQARNIMEIFTKETRDTKGQNSAKRYNYFYFEFCYISKNCFSTGSPQQRSQDKGVQEDVPQVRVQQEDQVLRLLQQRRLPQEVWRVQGLLRRLQGKEVQGGQTRRQALRGQLWQEGIPYI